MTTGNDKQNKEIIEWGCTYLSSHGYKLKNNLPDEIQNTPWSYVIRFATSDGYIYLKHTPELLALEAQIIQILQNQFHAKVANVIAQNSKLNCFLMKDAGKSLREILKKNFDEALVCKAIDQFTALQLTVADQVNVFLDIGVPDWRLNKFPDLFEQLISQKEILLADGLTEKEMGELEKLHPVVAHLCKKLSGDAIKATMVQPDFNDNNILINDTSQAITFIDLGEIAISHPFFSLLNFLQQMKKHHALTEDDDTYMKIKEACLKNFMNVESKNHLLDVLATADILSNIYGALSGMRLKLACDQSRFTGQFQRHGRLSVPLKNFITACVSMK